jgi:hypothetical protein
MAPDLGKTPKPTPISAVLRGFGNLASFWVAAIEAFLEFCAGQWGSPFKIKEPKASPVEKAEPSPDVGHAEAFEGADVVFDAHGDLTAISLDTAAPGAPGPSSKPRARSAGR